MDTGSPKKTGLPVSCVPIYMDNAPYTSDSQLAAIPDALSMASTEHTGVPKEVKKSGQHLEDNAPMWFSAT